MAFTDFEEAELIKLVSQNPLLYDPNDEDYHNLFVKESIWQTIGKALQKPVEECKKKWKFIRDGYTRYKKRCKGDIPAKNSKSRRHQMLAFLEKYQSVPSTDLEVKIDDDNDDSSQENFEEHFEFVEEDKIYLEVPDPPINHKIKREREDRESTPQSRKRQRKYDNDRLEREMHVERDDTNVRKREDDVDLFCRHIAEVLRNLPPLYKAKAKKHISAVVSEYEIKAAQFGSNASDSESLND